jgi:hypothetical protein
MATTRDLAERLLQTAPKHLGWSLAESPNAAEGYAELRKWRQELTYQAWSTDRRLRKPQLGLVLLWLESEVVRRDGGDGMVWAVLSKLENVPWDKRVYWELFNTAGQPTALHRELLEDAARHFSLRHTFDEADGQNWYRLIYLQFGFTHDDAVQRLAPWLSGQTLPISIQKLLEASDSGAQGFQQLWQSLRMFQLGNLPRTTLDTRLKSNPWVLPEWCDDLIEAAEKSSAPLMEVADLEAAEVRFFTTPRLGLSDLGVPRFTTSLCNLSDIGLESADYQLKSGDKVLARLMRQIDGSYFSDSPEAITLPVQPTLALSLVSSDGRVVAHDEAVLWDPVEEVSLYSGRTGAVIPLGECLRAGTELLVIAASDVLLRPEPAESYDLPLGYRLHRISSGWTGQIDALLDDDVVWTSSVATGAVSGSFAGVSARFIQALDLSAPQWAEASPPWSLPIRFCFPSGWAFSRLRWRRGDGRHVELDQMPSSLTLTEKDAVRPVVLRVRITNGSQHRTDVLKVPVPFVAVLKWTEDATPRRHPPGSNLLLGDARKLTWSFCMPSREGQVSNAREFSFAEGQRLLGRLKARRSKLPDLAGYGSRLCIVDDPYQSAQTVLTVADCVLDGGVLGAVRWSLEENGFRIRSSFTELGPDHRVQVWYSLGKERSVVADIPHDQLVRRDDGWFWGGGKGYHLHAVALTFRGTRLGAWFDHSSWSIELVKAPPTSVGAAAAMLRAWKAPVLKEDGDHFQRMIAWLSENYVRVLPVWLAQDSQQGPAGGMLEMPPRDESWCSVVNDLLVEALPKPGAEAAGELVERLAPNSTGVHALGSAMWTLAEVCPIFTAQLVKVYLEEFVSQAHRQLFLGQLLALPDFADTDERADELGRIHGNRDGFWLKQTVPTPAVIRQNLHFAIPGAYRLLSKSKAYRYYVLGRWLREIR